VKKSSRVCNSAGPRNWISRLARGLQVAKGGTRVKHAEELKSHASCCTTGQKLPAGQAVISQLRLATQSSREAKSPIHSVWEKLTFRFQTHTSINTPYTHIL